MSLDTDNVLGLGFWDGFWKRLFDLVLAVIALSITSWIILIAFILSTIDTRQCGFFLQDRVGRSGNIFKIIKIRTMRKTEGYSTSVTTMEDPRITKLGSILRKVKIDELPQLINVLIGHMSFVGPRPDVPGYADCLQGDDRRILSIRPGITGPATLRFRNEEALLARQKEPEKYNREVIFPEKVRLNLEYIDHYSFSKDLFYIWKTFLS